MSLHLPEEWGEGNYCSHVATSSRGVGRRKLLLSCRYIFQRSGEKETIVVMLLHLPEEWGKETIVVMSLQLPEEWGEENYCCHVATSSRGVGKRKLLLSCRYIFKRSVEKETLVVMSLHLPEE